MIPFHLVWLTVLFMVLAVPIVVIVLIVLAVNSSHKGAYSTPGPVQSGPAPTARETPMEILARRFASGEISADEYQRASDLLKDGGKP